MILPDEEKSDIASAQDLTSPLVQGTDEHTQLSTTRPPIKGSSSFTEATTQNTRQEQSTAPESSTMTSFQSFTIQLSCILSKLLQILTKTKLSIKILILLTAGIFLGCITPQNPNLPTPLTRYTSSIIGYTYFLCWSISFYPQIILNYQRKNTTGLSVDFSCLNVVGFGCYSIYVGFLFWSDAVREQYHHKFHQNGTTNKNDNPDDATQNSVQSNDVAFAFHAFVLSLIQVGQIIYYQRKRRPVSSTSSSSTLSSLSSLPSLPSSTNTVDEVMTRNILLMIHPTTKYFLLSCFLVCIIYAIFVIYNIHNIIFLDYLYMLSSIKLIITIIKYIPQVLLNYTRKSTVGWNIWNVLLDFSGGMLSLLQLILDAWSMNDFTAITGNWVKFGLSFVSFFFDVSYVVILRKVF